MWSRYAGRATAGRKPRASLPPDEIAVRFFTATGLKSSRRASRDVASAGERGCARRPAAAGREGKVSVEAATTLYQAYPILKSTARLPSFPAANSRLATMPWAGLRTYCTPAPTLGNRSDFEQPLRSPPYRQATPPNTVAVQRSASRCLSSTSIDDIDLPRYSPIV